jgi:predicted nucleic acid-binding Zn ribbon protein
MKHCPQCAKEYEDDKDVCPEDATPLLAKTTGEEPTKPSLTCAHCGKPLPDDKRFCVYCGAPSTTPTDAVPCPACGEAMPIGTLFCGACGMSLRASSPVAFSGTGTLSFAVPTRAVPQQEKRHKVWFGIGASLAALLLLGVGILIGRNLPSEHSSVTNLLEKPPPRPDSPQPTLTPPSPILKEEQLPPQKSVVPDLLPGRHQIIATEPVPVRKSPSEGGEMLGKASPGKTVVVVNSQERWVEIRSPSGESGYIPRDTVSPELVAEGEKKNSPQEKPKG